MSCNTFDQMMLDKLETAISQYMDAIIALTLANGVEEYTLNTGQGTQRVKRSDTLKLQETVGLLTQQRDTYVARCGNGGAVTMVPLCR